MPLIPEGPKHRKIQYLGFLIYQLNTYGFGQVLHNPGLINAYQEGGSPHGCRSYTIHHRAEEVIGRRLSAA